MNIDRLREAVRAQPVAVGGRSAAGPTLNLDRLKLAADAGLRAYAVELQEAADKDRWADGAKAVAGKSSGWRHGNPQCYSCRRVLPDRKSVV